MTEAPRRQRRRLRWLLVALVAAIAVLLALGLFPQAPLARWAESRLRAALGPGCHIGRLHVVPALLTVEATDIRIETATARLALERLRARVAPAALFSRRLVLDDLSASGASLSLDLAAPAAAPTAFPALPPIVARHVALDGERVTVMRAKRELLRLAGISVRGAAGEGTLAVDIAEATLSGHSLGHIQTQAAVSPRLDVALRSTTLSTAASHVQLTGALRRPPQGVQWDLDARGRVGLSDVLPQQAAGQIELTAKASGAGDGIDNADVRVEARHVTIRRVRLDRLSARLTRFDPRTTVAEVRAESGGGRAEARARLRDDQLRTDLALADVPLAGLLSPTEGNGLEAARISGSLTANGDLRRDLALDGQIAAHSEQPGATSWTASTALAGSFRPAVGALDVHFESTAETGTAPANALLARARLAVQGAASGTWPPRIDATASGDATLQLPGGPAALSFRATSLRYSRDGGALQADAELLGGHVTAAASVDPARRASVTLDADGLDLAPLSPRLRGLAQLRLRASGPAGRLDQHAQLALTRVTWDNIPLDSLTLTSDGPLQQAQLALAAPRLALSGKGVLSLSRRPSLTASISLDRSPLDPLGAWLNAPLTGTLSGRADVRVPFDDVRSFSLSSRIDSANAAYAQSSLTLDQPFLLSYDSRAWHLDGLSGSGNGLRLRGHARYDRGSARLDLQADFAADLARLPVPVDWAVAGQASGVVSLAGSIERPTGRGAIRLNDLRLQTPIAPEAVIPAARIELQGETAQLALPSAQLLGGTLAVTGTVPLQSLATPRTAAHTGALDLRWEGLDVARLITWLRPQETAPLRGMLSGSAHVDNPLSSWPQLRATVQSLECPLASDEVSFTLAPATVRLADGSIATDSLTLRSESGTLTARGSVDLRERQLAVSVSGNGDLRALSPFLGNAAIAGTATLDLGVRGPLAQPSWSGSLGVRDGSLRLREYPQSLTDLTAQLTFDGRRLVLRDLGAALGGGTLTGTGQAQLRALSLAELNVSLTAHDVGLIYPAGLRTRLDGDLTLRGQPHNYLLGGQLRVLRGLYDQDLATESAFAPTAPPTVSPALRSVRLELDVTTAAPLLVRNDIARLDAQGRLNVRGDLEVPRPYGRLDLLAGGQLYLQGRDFTIERGNLSYDGTWVPSIALSATTTVDLVEATGAAQQARRVTVTAEANGTVAELTNAWAARLAGNADTSLDRRLRLSSSEGLSQAQLAACLLGSCGGSTTPGGEARFVGAQAAALLAGQLATRASKTLQFLGIEEIRIQPELVARAGTPGARFTFAKRLTPDLRLIVSRGLQSAEESFFELEERPGYDISLSLQRRDTGEYIVGAGQRLSVGQRAARPARETPRVVSAVRVENAPPLLEPRLTAASHLRPGARTTFWQLQEAADRLRGVLVHEHYIEAEVSARLERDQAVFSVRSGPHYRLTINGLAKPPDLWPELTRALYEEEALSRGRVLLLKTLYAHRHYHARVTARAISEGPDRVLSFQVDPGARYHRYSLAFPGAQAFPLARLSQTAGGPAEIVAQPEQAVARIEALYRRERFLAARVSTPVVTSTADGMTIEIPITEGARAHITSVTFSGSQEPPERLAQIADMPPDAIYDDALVLTAMEKLRTHFLTQGYTDVRVSPQVSIVGGDVTIAFEIDPGTRFVAGELDVRGATTRLAKHIRRAAPIKPGQPIDAVALARFERRILTMASLARASVRQGPGNPAPIIVEVEPASRAQLGYDLSYGDKEHFGGQLDAELRDVGGLVTLGARYRMAADTRELRGSLYAPGSGFTATLFRLNEPPPAVTLTNPRVQSGVELQQSLRLAAKAHLLLGYLFKRVTIGEATPANVGAIDVTLVRESRDNPLDSHRGALLSLNLEIARPWLASQSSFVKGYAQALVATPLTKGLVWAQGLRAGLAYTSSGETLIPSERFTAGGATSLRGFATDSLGPKDASGAPAGGQALLVFNQELRYMHPSHLGFAVFYDLGSVFARPGDIHLSARQDVGIGLRWLSPIGLLRLDLAAPLAPRPGERKLRPFFSLGQAF